MTPEKELSMNLTEKIECLGITIITDDEYDEIYNKEHKHLSQGWLLDWHDTHAGTIERIALAMFIGSVVLLLVQLFPSVTFSDNMNRLLAACFVLSTASIACVIYRYIKLPTKTDRSNVGSSISGGFMNNEAWRKNISFPHEVYEHARQIQARYPKLHLDLRSSSLYLLHPGLPIHTERSRTIHQVQVSDPERQKTVTIGIWVHVRENEAA